MRKTIFIAVLSVSVLAAMIFWLITSNKALDLKEILMIIIQVVVVGFALVLAFSRLRSQKQNLPAEDEMSKGIKRRGAATAYYVSMYMWLAMMLFEEHIELERSTFIGAGIMGMALIFALCWVYHYYIRRSHD